ncbi:hypothetical protein PybrP1_005945 [[Pythium] brassicae (nom. inval.)]|nr:hypothetical protein PybrP1_005945 [[Pythium] brassicae (nom. inval.)]
MDTVINARAQVFRHRDHDDLHSVSMSWSELSGSCSEPEETSTRTRSASTVRDNELVMLPSAVDPLGRKIRRVTTDVVDGDEQLLLVKRRASAAKATALRVGRTQSLGPAAARQARRSARAAARSPDAVSVSCEDFEFVKALGVGAWGKVVLVRARRDGELYAMKVVSKRAVREQHLADKVLSERDVLGGTHHHSLATAGATTICGSYEYLAPEVFLRTEYGTAVDWWSFGVVVYEMLAGLPPWYSQDVRTMRRRILNKPLAFPGFVSEPARDLVSRLLQRDPRQRLGSRGGSVEVKRHAFFRDVDWQLMTFREVLPPIQPADSSGGSEDDSSGGGRDDFAGFNFEAPDAPLIEYGYSRDLGAPSAVGMCA